MVIPLQRFSLDPRASKCALSSTVVLSKAQLIVYISQLKASRDVCSHKSNHIWRPKKSLPLGVSHLSPNMGCGRSKAYHVAKDNEQQPDIESAQQPSNEPPGRKNHNQSLLFKSFPKSSEFDDSAPYLQCQAQSRRSQSCQPFLKIQTENHCDCLLSPSLQREKNSILLVQARQVDAAP
jgi:hypothetical protein